MNVQYFPFDVQYCVLTFGSWEYDATELQLVKQVTILLSSCSFSSLFPLSFSENIGECQND